MRLFEYAQTFAFYGGYKPPFHKINKDFSNIPGGHFVADRVEGVDEMLVHGTALHVVDNELDYFTPEAINYRGSLFLPKGLMPTDQYWDLDFMFYGYSNNTLDKSIYFITFEDGREFGKSNGMGEEHDKLALATSASVALREYDLFGNLTE